MKSGKPGLLNPKNSSRFGYVNVFAIHHLLFPSTFMENHKYILVVVIHKVNRQARGVKCTNTRGAIKPDHTVINREGRRGGTTSHMKATK